MDSSNNSHILKLVDRSNIVISGVNKLNSFDSLEFSIESVMGNIIIKGNNLELIKLDTIDGNVSIKGNIDGIFYSDISSHKDSIITKLFKWVV